jgi:hypothetical protein
VRRTFRITPSTGIQREVMADLAFVALTIVVFVALALVTRGMERL